MITEENKLVEVFGTVEVSVKEFMGSSDKSLVLLSDYEKAKQNLLGLKEKHELRVAELVAIEKLSPSEFKELNEIRAELREPRYLLQKIETNNVSVFEAYKKNDKAKRKELIDINHSLEETASEKLKVEEQRKKDEKDAELKAEENRIDKIKTDIDNIETNCSEIVQKMTFENMKVSAESIDQSLNADYDFEEYDILFDQVKGRVANLLLDKTNDITAREKQRQENEQMKQEIFDVRINRLKEVGYELLDGFFADKTFDSDERYSEEGVLNLNSALFETLLSEIKFKKEQIKQNAILKEEQRLKKEQQDEQFEVRKNRLIDIGLVCQSNGNFYYLLDSKKVFDLSEGLIYDSSVTEFEEILSKVKQDIVDAEAKVVSERFEHRKNTLIELGFEYKENEAPCFNDDKIRMGVDTLLNSSDEWFNNEVYLLKQVLEKETKKKADSENKARVKRLASYKKLYENVLKEQLSRFPIVYESKEIEIKNFSIECSNKVTDLLNELLTQLNDL